mmetsp:Transcript_8225/g.15719  ORF Transcript_8225/g.15719 Transcript_8225/m.15719 type:complete len:289 (-) Transcript_8225:329-1195(-)
MPPHVRMAHDRPFIVGPRRRLRSHRFRQPSPISPPDGPANDGQETHPNDHRSETRQRHFRPADGGGHVDVRRGNVPAPQRKPVASNDLPVRIVGLPPSGETTIPPPIDRRSHLLLLPLRRPRRPAPRMDQTRERVLRFLPPPTGRRPRLSLLGRSSLGSRLGHGLSMPPFRDVPDLRLPLLGAIPPEESRGVFRQPPRPGIARSGQFPGGPRDDERNFPPRAGIEIDFVDDERGNSRCAVRVSRLVRSARRGIHEFRVRAAGGGGGGNDREERGGVFSECEYVAGAVL